VSPLFSHLGNDGAVIALHLRSGRFSVTVRGEVADSGSCAGLRPQCAALIPTQSLLSPESENGGPNRLVPRRGKVGYPRQRVVNRPSNLIDYPKNAIFLERGSPDRSRRRTSASISPLENDTSKAGSPQAGRRRTVNRPNEWRPSAQIRKTPPTALTGGVFTLCALQPNRPRRAMGTSIFV
jgi:hypothetical protein